MIKLVSLYIILLQVNVSENLLTVLREDLLSWAFADWLKQGYFSSMEQRDFSEQGPVTCAEWASADWLA